MGNLQSSRASTDTTTFSKESKVNSARGRESIYQEAAPGLMSSILSLDASFASFELTNTIATLEEEEDFDESSTEDETDDDDDEEYEEWKAERAAILEDARNLKRDAELYLHPEAPVQADGLASARGFFTRVSASEQSFCEDEVKIALDDASHLKKLAGDFLHPELPVESTRSACARNYFTRLDGETEDLELERATVLTDAAQLKRSTDFFLHPEREIKTSSTACGRNYFTRFSAVEPEEVDMSELGMIAADLETMKRLATDYLHPERDVQADPSVFARNFFLGSAADVYEERLRILEDANGLKKLAVDCFHPELPVEVDAVCYGRNFFTRASAAEDDDIVKGDRAAVLADARSLKESSASYLHPEHPVVGVASGRNYFSRPSAEQGNIDTEEGAAVLADSVALKSYAKHYMHPEDPVMVEGSAAGRNYFDRLSADASEDEVGADRATAIAEATALKFYAKHYMHPELPVSVDGTAKGSNYFSRVELARAEDGIGEERSAVMEEARLLKDAAVHFMHPELPVRSDGSAMCRNYFMRPSAAMNDDNEGVDMLLVLEDAVNMKKLAVYFLHPELPIVPSSTASGRNFFTRPASSPTEDVDEEDRVAALADASKLKELTRAYMHPEMPVIASDSTAGARNYFDRPSAPLHYRSIHTFPPHEDDVHHDESENAHLDHFGMDDELDFMFEEMRQKLAAPATTKPSSKQASDEEEGKLSRSPSSVMLFTGESVYD